MLRIEGRGEIDDLNSCEYKLSCSCTSHYVLDKRWDCWTKSCLHFLYHPLNSRTNYIYAFCQITRLSIFHSIGQITRLSIFHSIGLIT